MEFTLEKAEKLASPSSAAQDKPFGKILARNIHFVDTF